MPGIQRMGTIVYRASAALPAPDSPFTWDPPTDTARSNVNASSTSIQLDCLAGDVVVIIATMNAGPISSVTSANLSFTFQARGTQTGNIGLEAWTAIAPSNLTNETITVQQSGSGELTVHGLSQSGANVLLPFDPNSPKSQNGSGPGLTFNTSVATAMAIVGYKMGATGSPTAGSGWTPVGTPGNFALVEWKQFTSVQTATTALIGSGDDAAAVGIIIAHDFLTVAVSYQEIDGGNDYYAQGYTNENGQVPYSNAIATHNWNGLTFAEGWDSDNFYPLGGWLEHIDGSSSPPDTGYWLDLYWTTMFAHTSTTSKTALQSAGIYLVLNSLEIESDPIGGPGWIDNNGEPGSETVGILSFDEPTSESIWAGPIQGNPFYGPPGAMTNARQDGRFWWTNFTAGIFQFGNVGGVPSAEIFQRTYATPDGSHRGIGPSGIDWYSLVLGHNASDAGYGAGASAIWGLPTPFTNMQIRKGTRDGDFCDIMRRLRGGSSPPTVAPYIAAIATGNAKTNISYQTPAVEFNWNVWGSIVHGVRAQLLFDLDDNQASLAGYENNIGVLGNPNGTPLGVEGYHKSDYVRTHRSCVVDGTMAGGVFTPSNFADRFRLFSGMQITDGPGAIGEQLLTQLTYATEATFEGATARNPSDGADNTIINIHHVVGTIPLPCMVRSPTMQTIPGGPPDPCLFKQDSGTAGGAGQYRINRQSYLYDSPDDVDIDETMTCWTVGRKGTYAVTGSFSGSGTFTFHEPEPVTLGPPRTASSPINSPAPVYYDQLKATCKSVIDFARLINARNAISYVRNDLSVGIRYVFPSHNGLAGSVIPLTQAYALGEGVDCCAKFYEGSNFSVGADTITPGYYIIATTSYEMDKVNQAVTFFLNDTLATSIDVIGEARSISLTDAGFGKSFNDTFERAWTVRIYKVNH